MEGRIQPRVRCVSSAGLLFEMGDSCFAVDCFSRDPEGLYPDTPPGIREELLGRIRRRELNTLIFTHEHGDHFCGQDVREACAENPSLLVFGGEAALSRLREMGAGEGQLRLIPAEGASETFGDFHIKFMDSPHEGEIYAEVRNLVLLISLGGLRLAVTGDAAPGRELFGKIRRWSPRIDWLFAPFPYAGRWSIRRQMAEELDVRHLFALHLPRPEKDAFHWRENTEKACARTAGSPPEVLLPEKIGEWYSMSFSA